MSPAALNGLLPLLLLQLLLLLLPLLLLLLPLLLLLLLLSPVSSCLRFLAGEGPAASSRGWPSLPGAGAGTGARALAGPRSQCSARPWSVSTCDRFEDTRSAPFAMAVRICQNGEGVEGEGVRLQKTCKRT
jgi:hypothetical protein